MPRKKRKPRTALTEAKAQLIARVIVKGQDPLKKIAADFNMSYAVVYKVLRERVNVTKVLSLRYPDKEETNVVEQQTVQS